MLRPASGSPRTRRTAGAETEAPSGVPGPATAIEEGETKREREQEGGWERAPPEWSSKT